MMRPDSLLIIVRVITDFAIYLWFCVKPSRNLAAENLFLRKQLALYQERKIRPRSTDPATRFTMAFFSKRFDWRDALVIVQPRTLIRWHQQCYRMIWRNKSQAGRPGIPPELQRLIRRMANENITLGRGTHCQRTVVKTGYCSVTSKSQKIHAKELESLGTSWGSEVEYLSQEPR